MLVLIRGFPIISKFPSPVSGHICADSSHSILLISCTNTLQILYTLYAVNVVISVKTVCVVAPHQFLTNHQNVPGPFKEILDSIE